MLGPILLPREAERIRQQLAEWTLAGRIQGDDFTVDDHGHRVYEVSKLNLLIEPLLQKLDYQPLLEKLTQKGCQYDMYRSSININKKVSTFGETILIPICAVSGLPQIIDLAHGVQRLLPRYFYVLRSDILVGPEADFIVVREKLEKLAYPG